MSGVKFDQAGLVPVIAVQWDTREILMMAWMNAQTLQTTLQTGRATYWSRSRGEEWRKGDTSGHLQFVRTISRDCDGDTLLMEVDQIGPACHTGSRSCFDAATVTVSAAQAPEAQQAPEAEQAPEPEQADQSKGAP